MTIPRHGPEPPDGTRPVTYYQASSARNLVTARQRHDDLTDRDLCVRTVAQLRERGEFDPHDIGDQALAERKPLSVAEHLELMAAGEVLARYYRHPALLDHAVTAGATWEQVGDARGTTASQARHEYREWAKGQHWLYAEYEGKWGLSDADYAEALARAGEPEPGSAKAHAATHPVLCAHADRDGAGAHWLEPGERCTGAWPPAAARDVDPEAGQ
jgi:hypothetical protein